MEQKIAREWKSIVCPDRKENAIVMCEWDIFSEMGRILKKTLNQTDCHNPKLTEFGGADCDWACRKVIAKEEITRSRRELPLVSAIFIGGIIWIVVYGIYMKPYFHLSGLLFLFGIPLFISLILYYSWKMMSFGSKAQM